MAISRRMFLMGGVSIFPYLYLERIALALKRYQVPIRNLPPTFEGFTILHLSDLHDKEFGEGGEELINLVRKERFDLIALTGDLVQGEQPLFTPALELVGSLLSLSKRPMLSVLGNHDWRLGRGDAYNEKLREAGVQVLSNTSSFLERGTDRLWLVGVDDPVTGRDRLEVALEGTDDRSPRLLLSHSPQLFPQAASLRVDLMLSGHTHGGQIRFPVLGALYVPRLGFFPPWDYGLYSKGATTLIVSGGLGESGLPIRFNIRPEVALITLRRSPSHQTQPQTAA